MSAVKNPSSQRALPPFQQKRAFFAPSTHAGMSGTGHASACPVVDVTHKNPIGAVAPATVGGASAPVQNQRESSSRCGSAGDNSTDWALTRRDKYRLQRVAGKVLNTVPDFGRNRVCVCSRHSLRYGAEGAGLSHNITQGRAWLEGLATCDSPWLCAVCAGRIGEERADDVRRIENYARDNDLGLSLLTLTSHHTLKTDLAELLRMQAEALKLFWAGREAQRLKKHWGLIGSIRAFEITHSKSAGFHPHYHYLMVTNRKLTDAEREELADVLFKRWVDCSTKVGLEKPSLKGFDLKTGVTAGQYVAKWGLAREMSKGSTKVGRGENSRNMWQILSDAENSPADATLWGEYAKATRGKAQQYWSPALKKILEAIKEEEAKEAEQEAEGKEPDEIDYLFIEEMAVLDLYTTDVVNRDWCNLFEIVERFGLGPVRDYLHRRRNSTEMATFDFWGGREPYEFGDVSNEQSALLAGQGCNPADGFM